MRYTPAQLQTLTLQALTCAQKLRDVINETCQKCNYPVQEGTSLADALYTLHTAISETPTGTDLLTSIKTGASALWESAVTPATILLAHTWGTFAHYLPGPRIRPIELLDACEQASATLADTYLLPHDPYDPIRAMFTEIHTRISDLGGEAEMDQLLLRTASEIFSASMISARIELLGLALIALTNPHLSQDTPEQTLQLVIAQIAQQPATPPTQAHINALWRTFASAETTNTAGMKPAPVTQRLAQQIAPGHAFCAKHANTWVLAGAQLPLTAAANGRASDLVSYQAITTSAPERVSRNERVVTLSAANPLETPRLLIVDTIPGVAWEIARLGAGIAITNNATRLWHVLRAYQPQLVVTATPAAAALLGEAQKLTLPAIAQTQVRTPTLFDVFTWEDALPQVEVSATSAPATRQTENTNDHDSEALAVDIPTLKAANYAELILLVRALMEPLPQLLTETDKARLLEGRAAYTHANYSTSPAQLRAVEPAHATETIALLGPDMELPNTWQDLPNLQILRIPGLPQPQLGGLLR